MLETGYGGCNLVRLLTRDVLLSAALVCGAARCVAADLWGGSLAVTSDYMVRGVTRSNDRGALQLDVHYLNSSGFVIGLFASNTQIDPGEPADVELDGFIGFAWTAGSDWRSRALLSHYAYPWNSHGSGYDYDELDLDATYREWLNIDLVYSPNAPIYSYSYRGLIGVTSESAQISVQRPVWRKLSATLGVGYSRFAGEDPAGYAYWSAGAAWDLAPVSFALSYVNATAEAKALFYNDALGARWTGTVIWRF
ncbi:MAG: TorF family putative porin [Gammaproteobacteria bacterium]